MPQPIVVRSLLADATGLLPVPKQQEAAGAVGVFRGTRPETSLAESGRLLVTGCAAGAEE
jgi:hypothetical protein